ncbi:hypothetical protein P171DRAFT_429156 [Karstenula rhodostoma CBS 690.94]|uniref:Uncharacterized protein n=1 Tax=Karstenula rhodostoma CBS 690.94 TaxID=1392251 RepID=A0A9P4PNM1_9PLEO|nr:hypothetical protein P171DRAFT_429156 [Karstenula rhodostoma CBS 690.94]
MNESELTTFLTPLGQGSSWGAKCVRRLLEADNLTNIAQGLVAQNGYKPVKLVKGVWDAWGIDMMTCHAYCDRRNFPMVFDFPIFTSGVTNYLLPWLGLTAQLPYETGTVSGNFESFCLAVGSPMLTTFSLMSTTLNAHSTSKVFEAKFGNGKTEAEMREAVKAAEYFLCGSQQSPIRIKEDRFRELFHEEPARLRDRWVIVKQRLHNTRRQYTFSLVTQTSFAFIAWILTIIGSYATALGQHSEALLLSSGTLWTWLVPIVLGWMAVGVQSREDTVRDAIRGESTAMKALEAASGFLNRPPQTFEALLGDVQGDEKLQGPAYNYARILTYPKLRDRVVSAFEEKLRSLSHQVIPAIETVAPTPEAGTLQVETVIHKQDSARSSALDSASASASASAISQTSSTGYQKPQHRNTNQLETAPVTDPTPGDDPYMTWQEVTSSSDWIKNFLLSNVVAVILQWGVTGSAIVVSYLTEVRGLGCRSGSYLLYGILATSAHVLLLASVFLSHSAMLIYQRTQSANAHPAKSSTHPRSAKHAMFCTLAVATRYLGKCLAVINALWIVLSSVFELIGFYESCWCTGTVLGLGNKAWVVLFVSGDKMREDAEPSWIGGLTMSLLTMVLTYLLTKSYSWGRKN